MIEQFKKTTEYYVLKGIPVFVIVDGWSFGRLCSKLDYPFSEDLAQLCGATLVKVAGQIPVTFGYQFSDKFIFVFSPVGEEDPWFKNNLQHLCSATTSLVTYHFCNLWRDKYPTLDLNGDPYFKSEVFGVSNLSASLDLLTELQQQSLNFFFDSVLNSALPEVDITNLVWKDKQQLIQLNEVNVVDYPLYLKFGSCCYKENVLIPSKDGNVTRKKWKGFQNLIFPKDRELLFQILLNGYATT